MRIIPRLRQLVAREPEPQPAGPTAVPPAEPAGPAIQAREQEAAKARLLEYARLMPSERVYRYGQWWAR